MGHYVKAPKICTNPACEKANPVENKFCAYCGTKLPPAPTEKAMFKHCPNPRCNNFTTDADLDKKFCGLCGAEFKIEETERPKMILVTGNDPHHIG